MTRIPKDTSFGAGLGRREAQQERFLHRGKS
jgi:hypothetical protein